MLSIWGFDGAKIPQKESDISEENACLLLWRAAH